MTPTDNPAPTAPAVGEWIEWHGGENPVPGQMVDAEFGDVSLHRCTSDVAGGGWKRPGRYRLVSAPAVPEEGEGPYRAEFGAIHHEDRAGFLFTVTPAKFADDVADALNRRPTPSPASPDREEIVEAREALDWLQNEFPGQGDTEGDKISARGWRRHNDRCEALRSLLAKLDGGS